MSRSRTRTHHHGPSSFEYGLYYSVAFLAFLPAAALRQVVPGRPDAFGRRTPRKGVIGEAREMAATVVPFVFMH